MRSFLYWHIVNPMSIIKPGVVTQTCNLSTQKVGWEDSRVQGNPGLQGLVSKTKQNKIKTKQAHHPNLPNAVVYVAMHGRLHLSVLPFEHDHRNHVMLGLTSCLSRGSCCCDETPWQKVSWGEWVCDITVHHQNQGRNLEAAYWLDPHGLLCLLSYRT